MDTIQPTGNLEGNTLEDIETINQTTNEIVQDNGLSQGNEIVQGNMINSVIVNDITNDVIEGNSVSNGNLVANSINNENVIQGNEGM